MKENKAERLKEIKLKVRRFVPSERTFRESDYKISADKFTTVLDALIGVKEKEDHTLSVRYSCRMGICGSCAMVINGKPRLACETNIFSLESNSIAVGPLEAMPQIRDLVTDFTEFFEKHKSVMPWLIRRDVEEKFAAEREFKQARNEVDFFLPFSYCIKCGLCVDACPVSNTNISFVGPQALAQAYRYNSDSRDEGEKERLQKLDALDGVWGCEFAGACSYVCPKGVDPALAIQLLKLDVMKYSFTGRTSQTKRVL